MAELITVFCQGEVWAEAGADGFSNETGGYPPGWGEGATPEELVAAHAARIEVPDAPVDKIQVGRSIVVEDFAPVVVLGLRDYTTEEVASLQAQRVAEVKAEARGRILAIMDKDRQDNALALGQEMIFLHGPDPAGWPEAQRDEYAAVMAKWTLIKAIRTASDAIEAGLPTDAEGLCAFIAAAADGWPA